MPESQGNEKNVGQEENSLSKPAFYLKLMAFGKKIDFKMAIKMAVAAVLSLYLSDAFSYFFPHPNNVLAALWCVITAVIVLQASLGGTYKAIWLRFVGVVIGSSIGVLFAFFFGADEVSMGVAILTTIFICSLLKIPDSYRLAALSVVVILLPWKANPSNSPWIYAFFRFADTCIGFVAALLVSHVLWPSRAIIQIRNNMAEQFQLFRQYLDLLFNLNLEGSSDPITVEAKIQESFMHRELILEESKVELFRQTETLNHWMNLIKNQEQIWENLQVLQGISYSTLQKIFDDSLRHHIQYTISVIDFIFNEIARELLAESKHFSIHHIGELQESLNQEIIRFRSTHPFKPHSLEDIEDCFVLFYQLRQILANLKTFVSSFQELKITAKA